MVNIEGGQLMEFWNTNETLNELKFGTRKINQFMEVINLGGFIAVRTQ